MQEQLNEPSTNYAWMMGCIAAVIVMVLMFMAGGMDRVTSGSALYAVVMCSHSRLRV